MGQFLTKKVNGSSHNPSAYFFYPFCKSPNSKRTRYRIAKYVHSVSSSKNLHKYKQTIEQEKIICVIFLNSRVFCPIIGQIVLINSIRDTQRLASTLKRKGYSPYIALRDLSYHLYSDKDAFLPLSKVMTELAPRPNDGCHNLDLLSIFRFFLQTDYSKCYILIYMDK
jgi:hypothetical protein